MPPPLWHLDGNQARFSIAGDLSGAVDLLRPASGLALRGRGVGITAFAVDLPPVGADEAKTQLDVWARDGDLVATYAATNDRPTRGQIYWRSSQRLNHRSAVRDRSHRIGPNASFG